MVTKNPQTALIMVDVQNDFVEGGAMGVTGGVATAEKLAHYLTSNHQNYDLLVTTQDWHINPGTHWVNEGETPNFDTTWPKHCEANTWGSEFVPIFAKTLGELVVNRKKPELWQIVKGEYEAAYSGFEGHEVGENEYATLTSLLKDYNITHVDVVGIATDYCVKQTALDAHKNGFTTNVLTDYTAGVNPTTTADALTELKNNGVTVQ